MIHDFQQKRAVAVIFNAEGFIPSAQWWKVVKAVPLNIALRDEWGVIYTAAKASAPKK